MGLGDQRCKNVQARGGSVMIKWVVTERWDTDPDDAFVAVFFGTRKEARREKRRLKKGTSGIVVKMGRITEVR